MGKPKRSGRKSRRTAEIMLLVLAVAVFMLWQSLTRPIYYFVQTLSVEGNRRLETEEVFRMASWDGTGFRVFWDGRPFLLALGEDVRVSEASVAYEWPGHVKVEIRERLTVATMLSQYGYVEIDSDGVVGNQFKNLRKLNSPFITGITAGRVFPGQKVVDGKLSPLLQFLETLSSEFRDRISEINVSNDGIYILFLIDKTRVRLGALDNPVAKARILQEILNELATKKVVAEVIDLTHETPTLRLKQK